MVDRLRPKRQKAEARAERTCAAWLTSMTTLLSYVWWGPWVAFAYSMGLLALAVVFGAYSYGLDNAEDSDV